MGTTITWTDFDTAAFTVVIEEGLFEGHIEPNGGTWSYLFKDPGYLVYSIDPYNAELCGAVIVLE
jgi:plastocyanin